MKALIFGVSSQDGCYLEKVCEHRQIEVDSVSQSHGNWIQASVRDWNFVESFVRTQQPHIVFHVAANPAIRHDALSENHDSISTGALNVLEAVNKHCQDINESKNWR